MDDHLYHFWIIPYGPVLCDRFEKGDTERLECLAVHPDHKGPTLCITLDKSLVTCNECLKLLHS